MIKKLLASILIFSSVVLADTKIVQPDPSIHKDGNTTTIAEIPFSVGLSSDANIRLTQPNALMTFDGAGDSGIYDTTSGAGIYPQNSTESGTFIDAKGKCKVNVDTVTVMNFLSTGIEFLVPSTFIDTVSMLSTLDVTGRITSQAGTGGGAIGVGGTLAYSVTQTGSSTTGAVDAWTVSIPANTLNTNGDSLTFDFGVFAANTANNKQFTITLAGTTIGNSTSIGAQNGHAHVRGICVRQSSTHLYCSVFNNTLSKWSSFSTYTDVTVTLSSSTTFKVVFATAVANNDTLFRVGRMNWEPVQ